MHFNFVVTEGKLWNYNIKYTIPLPAVLFPLKQITCFCWKERISRVVYSACGLIRSDPLSKRSNTYCRQLSAVTVVSRYQSGELRMKAASSHVSCELKLKSDKRQIKAPCLDHRCKIRTFDIWKTYCCRCLISLGAHKLTINPISVILSKTSFTFQDTLEAVHCSLYIFM